MNDKSFTATDIQILQDEYLVGQILELLFLGKDEQGRPHTIESACKQVGISPRTWYRWAKDGSLEAHKTALAAQVSSAVQEIVIPHYREIYEGLVAMALGRRPANADPGMKIKASDMLKAIKLLATVIPVQPLVAPDQNNGTEAEDFLEGAQFKQIFVQGDMNFIYQGNGQPQFGQLEGDEVIEAD